MRAGALALALLAAAAASPGAAQDVVGVKLFHEVEPAVLERVTVQSAAGPWRTFGWRQEVTVRVRETQGIPFTAAEREAVRAFAVACERGQPRGVEVSTELLGTTVIRFDCLWIDAP